VLFRSQGAEECNIPVAQAACDVLGVGVHGARECHVRWPHTQGIRRR